MSHISCTLGIAAILAGFFILDQVKWFFLGTPFFEERGWGKVRKEHHLPSPRSAEIRNQSKQQQKWLGEACKSWSKTATPMLPKHCFIKQHIFLLHQFLAVGTITLQRLFLKIVAQCGNSKQPHYEH